MLPSLANAASMCCRTSFTSNQEGGDEEPDRDDPLLWSKDLEKHSCGEYSFAVCQANEVLEDFSQVETGANAMLVGIYDGHYGPEAAKFVAANLFKEIARLALNHNTISQSTLAEAIASTEIKFLQHVRNEQQAKPKLVCMGTCCLVGIIWKGNLLIANLGDSRAVMGYINHSNEIIFPTPLTKDHNVNREDVRRELMSAHTDDPNIVFHRLGAYRVKGILKVSKSIGDAYMKHSKFVVHPSLVGFHLPVPIWNQPAISSDPDLFAIELNLSHKFIIFASSGFWDILTIQEVVELVHKNPREGIAKRLIKVAQKVASRKVSVSYKEVAYIDKGFRKVVHDDMTVVVVFIDHGSLGKKTLMKETSIKGFGNMDEESEFASLKNLM